MLQLVLYLQIYAKVTQLLCCTKRVLTECFPSSKGQNFRYSENERKVMLACVLQTSPNINTGSPQFLVQFYKLFVHNRTHVHYMHLILIISVIRKLEIWNLKLELILYTKKFLKGSMMPNYGEPSFYVDMNLNRI